MARLRRYFISGLLVWLPIWVTILVIKFLVDILDGTLSLLPHSYRPDELIGFHIPGIGVVITLLVILSTGVVVANFIGSRLIVVWDAMIGRIPLVRTVYMGVKQVTQTIFTSSSQSFRKVFLVEYPRKGCWTMAFQTCDTTPPFIDKAINVEQTVSLFVPTTPNPTSGFLLIVPRENAIELDMGVEQALKFVISLGVVQPLINGDNLKR